MGTIIPVQWYETEANKNIHFFMKIFAFLHYGIYLFIYLLLHPCVRVCSSKYLTQGKFSRVFNSGFVHSSNLTQG